LILLNLPKVKLVNYQQIFIDNFKIDDVFDLFPKKIEITKKSDDKIKTIDLQDLFFKKIFQ